MTYTVGYMIGSLSAVSINRILARALVRLAPPEVEQWLRSRSGICRSTTGSLDSDYPPEARALKDAIADVDAMLFVPPGIQPRHSRRAQECHRLGQSALGAKFLCAQAVRRYRRLSGQDRHRRRAAELAQHFELLQLAPDECTGGLYPVHARSDQRRRGGHRRDDPEQFLRDFMEQFEQFMERVFMVLPRPSRAR